MPSFASLTDYAARLLAAAGLDGDKPEVTARLLVTADAMGHTTHGLAQLPDYLEDILAGAMAKTGTPQIVSDKGAAIVWDGQRLPGVWLTDLAVRTAAERARTHGLCAISIRRSHHIACLATFLPAATDQGLMAIIASSDPSDAHVAPYGGRKAVFTPDPIAIGIPAQGDAIWIDMSASITTAGMSARLRREGGTFPGQWALDAQGQPSNDPHVLTGEPKGTLLPTGGMDHGHKGYGLALMVEALTQGLSGYGRADREPNWGASVFVQVFDPALFGGLAAFVRQSEWMAQACRDNPPVDPASPVRLPGAQAAERLRAARQSGFQPRAGLLEALQPWAEQLEVAEL